MNFEKKREQSLALLAQKGIKRTVYEPPAVKLLWKLGIKARPPHFMNSLGVFALSAVWYGPLFGVVEWILSHLVGHYPLSVRSAAIGGCAFGAWFGLVLAISYAREKKKHELPDWESLGETA